jgi:subtilisin family serine protease
VSDRALERRARRGRGPVASAADLPVDAACRDAIRATGARVVTTSRWLNAVSVAATPAESALIAALPCVDRVARVGARVSADPPAPGSALPNGGAALPPPAVHALGYGRSLAQLAQINVPALHDSGASGAGVVVGLLDTGFERTHGAFASTAILAERDFVNDDGNTADESGENVSGHGTAVFSAIGAFVPDTLIGVAYGATYVLAKTEIVSSEVPVEEDLWVAGLEWEESLGVDVVSSSLGYLAFPNEGFYTYEQMDGRTAVTTRAATLAVERGVVMVNSMGNEQQTSWHYLVAPADAECVVSVGAVDGSGTATFFTSVGPTADGRLKPDVAALGLGTYVARTDFGGGSAFGENTGTSFAAPLIAGVAALLLERDPDLTPSQVQTALRRTASHAGSPDLFSGYGVANALAASSYAAPDSHSCLVLAPLALHKQAGDLFVPALGDLGWAFDLPAAGPVTARVYDVSGREVAILLDRILAAATGIALPWDGRAAGGHEAAAGIYVLGLETPAGTVSSRVVLVR